MTRIMTEYDMQRMARRIASTGGYINDNYRGSKDENTLQTDMGGVVLLAEGKLALWFAGNCYINVRNAYLDDSNIPHLSSWSNGGSCTYPYYGFVPVNRKDVDEYNKSKCDEDKIVSFIPLELRELNGGGAYIHMGDLDWDL